MPEIDVVEKRQGLHLACFGIATLKAKEILLLEGRKCPLTAKVRLSDAQGRTCLWIQTRCPGFWAGVEVRVQVKPQRFRVPDVVVMRGGKLASRVVPWLETRRAWIHTSEGSREAKDGVLRNAAGDLAVPLAAIFD